MRLNVYRPYLYGVLLISMVGAVFYLVACLYGDGLMQKHAVIPYRSFDDSMQTARYADKVVDDWGKTIVQTFRTLYERNTSLHVPYSQDVKIPKIIHQIWLGSDFPHKYRSWQQSWIDHHPQWRYYLWTDADIETLRTLPDFFIGNTYAYFEQATNYAERSDILRILLLHYYGGLYVDTDFEALRSFDVLHHYYDFYTGMQPLDVAYVQLGYALIGSAPRHYLLQALIAMLDHTRNQKAIVMRTGPLMMTMCLQKSIAQAPGCNIVFPASYFYPMGYTQQNLPQDVWMRPESFAVHHWEGSWLSLDADMRSKRS